VESERQSLAWKYGAWLRSCGIDAHKLAQQALLEAVLCSLPPDDYQNALIQIEAAQQGEPDVSEAITDARKRIRELANQKRRR
jgi:hypothetical protein